MAVDAAQQIIVAYRLMTNAADARALVPLIDDVRARFGRGGSPPISLRGERVTARRMLPVVIIDETPLMQAMVVRLKRASCLSRYRLRKQVVEPVFGQIKQARGFRQFLLRGLDQIRGKWAMICIAHNLLKLAKARG